jgi:aerobic-type carbon monoxide dehydrogenase small subunit (CoxS/CutS family)
MYARIRTRTHVHTHTHEARKATKMIPNQVTINCPKPQKQTPMKQNWLPNNGNQCSICTEGLVSSAEGKNHSTQVFVKIAE